MSSYSISSSLSQSSILILSLSSSSLTSLCPLVLETSFYFSMSTSIKVFSATWKFEFSSKSLNRATWYGSTNSSSWKTSSHIVNSLLPSWTTWTWPLVLVFTTDNQSTLEQSFLRKIVCVINLLALLDEKKIIDITESSLCINFDQTMMRICFDSFVSDQ